MTNHIHLILSMLIMLLGVIVYGKYVRCSNKGFPDILDFKFNSHIDGWCIMHFVAYIPIGILFPDMFYSAMLIGIAWEFIEVWIGETKPSFMKGIGDCGAGWSGGNRKPTKLLSDNKDSDGKEAYWWYGQYEDVIANCLGFLVGSYFFSAKR